MKDCKIKRENIFLIDGIGAILSTLCFLVFIYFEDVFGMPKHSLKLLIAIGCLFSIFSLSCHYLGPKNWRKYLTILAILNSIYCVLTIYLVYINAEKLTIIGNVYFIVELLIIIILIICEYRLSKLKKM